MDARAMSIEEIGAAWDALTPGRRLAWLGVTKSLHIYEPWAELTPAIRARIVQWLRAEGTR